ncbi:MAG: TonB-dependent receptor [Rhodospirillales bacterium]|nr:TonB-dependent receptor [Rhodospirillales bacterium]
MRPPHAAVILVCLIVTFTTHRGHAQSSEPGVPRLPETVVTATRIGDGVTGASTTIITADEIQRSSAATLPELLARQPGIQVQTLFGGGTGTRSVVDMRGFGAAATSNTLLLINGRRVNDPDLAGVDYSTIPRESIARIEITRGNSGAVLYGDGAVGGVINIVTKTVLDAKPGYRVDGGLGSYDYREGAVSATQSFGPASASLHANAINADGYRRNNMSRQRNAVADVRYRLESGSVYLNLWADDQYVGLPGGRLVTLTSSELLTNRRGAATPRDFAEEERINVTIGGTRNFGDDLELVLDGGLRRKTQHSFVTTIVDTTVSTFSLTPRLNVAHRLFGAPSRTILGVDLYYWTYDSDRRQNAINTPFNTYEGNQLVAGAYIQETVAVRPDTDVSAGIRLVSVDSELRNRANTAAPGGAFETQGTPFSRTEEHYAAHLGVDHRLTEWLALFGRVGRSLRTPTVDERVGSTSAFDLRSQRSHDLEAGFRLKFDRFDFQSSAYVMKLKNELHFNPVTFTNVNLDPTRRQGVEALAGWRIGDALKLKGGLAFTDAEFRSGPFATKEVPLVSSWTGSAGLGWDIVPKMVELDLDVRYTGERRLDNDQKNFQPQIPDSTVTDLRLGGEIDRFRWSLAVLNLFDVDYFDYGIASSTTFGRYNAYPQPGRTFMGRLGANF